MYSNIKPVLNVDKEYSYQFKEYQNSKVEIHTYIPGDYIPTEITVVSGDKSYKAILKKVKYLVGRDMYEITYGRYK